MLTKSLVTTNFDQKRVQTFEKVFWLLLWFTFDSGDALTSHVNFRHAECDVLTWI